jgi:carbon starvation protein
MLLEGLVAVIALATVMIIADSERGGRSPGVLYGDGLALFVTGILDPGAVSRGGAATSAVFLFAATFGAMAFSTFVFDTLDVSTRLGRYLLTELFATRSRAAGVLAAGLTAGIPLVVLLASPDAAALAAAKRPPTYMLYWTLFGTSNQLLAALTLLGVTVWLRRSGRRYWYTLVPMIFVMTVTLWALGVQIFAGGRHLARSGPSLDPAIINAGVAVALVALAAIFIVEALRARAPSAAA